MSEPQRQHPVAAIAKALDIIRGNFITILIFLFIGGGEQALFNLYWILGTIVVLLAWGTLSWLRFSFRVEEGELFIEQGVLIRKKLYLTADRIQVIDISAGLIQRLFGLVAVEVKTAGTTSKQAKISALTREKAEQLKDRLRRSMDEGAAQITEDTQEETVKTTYTLGMRELLVAATTSGRMGVALSLVGAGFSQVDQLFSEEQMYRFVESSLPRSASITLIAMAIVAAVAIAWLFSFMATIIAYYDFKVEVKKEELLISRGLLERKQLTIPFNRIQAVQVKEELLRQPFGYASLVIESAGYGEKEGNSTTLFPLIKRREMYSFLKKVLPEYNYDIDAADTAPPMRSLRRYLFRMLRKLLPVIVLLWTFVPYGVYAWFLLIPALLLTYRQYKDAGVRSEGHTIIASGRRLSKWTVIMKQYRIQAAQIKENPFQSRLDLQDIIWHVASGNRGRSFMVRDLDAEAIKSYWGAMYEDSNDYKKKTLSQGLPIKSGDQSDSQSEAYDS